MYLKQLNLNPVHTVKKCPVYLHVPLIGNVSMMFEKQITSAVKRCFYSVEPRVVFTTRQLLPATKKDVLPSHHQNNAIYQFVCLCDSRYVGRTSHNHQKILFICLFDLKPGGKRYETTCAWLVDSHGCTV